MNKRVSHHNSWWVNINKGLLRNALKPQKSPTTFDIITYSHKRKLDSCAFNVTSGTLSPTSLRKLKKVFQRAKWKKNKATKLTFAFDYGKITYPDGIFAQNIDSIDIKNASLDLITLSVTQTGFINCDRFYNAKKKKQLYVTANPSTSVKIIFNNFNGIIQGKRHNSRFHFGEIPMNEPYEILSYKEEGEKVFVAHKTSHSDEELVYKTMTRKEFIQLLEDL